MNIVNQYQLIIINNKYTHRMLYELKFQEKKLSLEKECAHKAQTYNYTLTLT